MFISLIGKSNPVTRRNTCVFALSQTTLPATLGTQRTVGLRYWMSPAEAASCR
ncbi:hypothetical protein [Leisingera sp. NJS204]|uniref:hypothetical protein n=1 Tax=Leisingera sp. NJS204 TaxID=2508307 RepID=UPI0013E8FCC2|nr:hypothetical protein [Leisingera sp. NJS204]